MVSEKRQGSQFSCYLSRSDYAKLKRLAKKKGKTIYGFVKMILMEYLEEQWDNSTLYVERALD